MTRKGRRDANRIVVGVLPPDRGFTEGVAGFSINIVRSWTEQLLTKRRAVDFCRVATALCPCA